MDAALETQPSKTHTKKKLRKWHFPWRLHNINDGTAWDVIAGKYRVKHYDEL